MVLPIGLLALEILDLGQLMLKIPGLTLAIHRLLLVNEFEDSAQQGCDEHLLYERYLFHLLLLSFFNRHFW